MKPEDYLVHAPFVSYSRDLTDIRKIIEITDNIQTLIGYKRAEILDSSAFWTNLLHEVDRPSVLAQIDEFRRGQSPTLQLEYRLRNSAGHFIWVRDTIKTLHDQAGEVCAIVGYWLDVTEDMETKLQLKESERFLFDAQDAANVGCYKTDLNTGVWQCTPVMDRIFGITPDYPHNVDGWAAFMHPDFNQPMHDYLTQCIAEKLPFDAEYRMFRPSDGEERWMHGLGKIIYDEQGRPTYLLGTVADITERKKSQLLIQEYSQTLEQKVEERTAELKIAKDLAEQASYAKSQFLANMSHEIRTPMNAIIGLTYLMQHENKQAKIGKSLNKIKSASNHLLGIINNILDVSKIESNTFQLELSPNRIGSIFAEIKSIIGGRAKDSGLSLNFDLQHELQDTYLLCDSLRLNQILINLVNNAIKFTERGGIEVIAKIDSVEGDNYCVKFEVTDTGIGIQPEQKSRIFKAFEQADISTSRKYGGTGLGLMISQLLVNHMQGEIGVEDNPGGGSCFWFTIKAQLGVAPARDKRVRDESVRIKQGARILLVEDNEINRDIVQEILSVLLDDASVDVAINGIEAVEKASANDYDLVLMDMQMPVMDGLDATVQIRQQPNLRALPIIAMTANAFAEDRLACEKAGMNGFVSKPIDIDAFVKTLGEFLS